MNYSDFLNWSEIASNTFTKETLKNINWRNIRVATFRKTNLNQIELKYSMKEDAITHRIKLFEDVKRKRKGKGKNKSKENTEEMLELQYNRVKQLTPKQLYTDKLPITAAKYKDLQRLCDQGTIHKRFHAEYKQLPCQSHNVIDTLPETDEEDEISD